MFVTSPYRKCLRKVFRFHLNIKLTKIIYRISQTHVLQLARGSEAIPSDFQDRFFAVFG